MPNRQRLAIIGSGPSCLYLLKHLLERVELFRERLAMIGVFEKGRATGMGMPYSPETTDRLNLSNISSEELPRLTTSFADWLRGLDAGRLAEFGIEPNEISESEVYSRLALGEYLHAQYQAIVARLAAAGIPVRDHTRCKIVDVREEEDRVALVEEGGERFLFNRAVLATGHYWPEDDHPEAGYYASPWPVAKLLPREGEAYGFTIGTLGSSLSAFDVVSSLAHRQGAFVKKGGGLVYQPHPGSEKFRVVMHSADGLLPHLQYAQAEPMREIERHVSEEDLRALRDERGCLRLATYFDRICRPVLRDAFAKDQKLEIVALLSDPAFDLEGFVRRITEEHRYADAFAGLRSELKEAEDSVAKNRPIHWKEALDDLMYTLSFHAEWLPAEDHLTLHRNVLPFVMNVTAALPLPSACKLLALREAGHLTMMTGKANVADRSPGAGTTITVSNNGNKADFTYRLFVDCSGQGALKLEDFPFPSLAARGAIREARAAFSDASALDALPKKAKAKVFAEEGNFFYPIGGIEVDRGYRVIARNGRPSARIYDMAFPHVSGLRPYAYGLQACHDTARLLVEAWAAELTTPALE